MFMIVKYISQIRVVFFENDNDIVHEYHCTITLDIYSGALFVNMG